MIDAYYSRGCDSYEPFKDTEIAKNDNFRKHMNRYNVIRLDISSFWDSYKDNIVEKIVEYIFDELKEVYGEQIDCTKMINSVIMSIYQKTKIPL